MSKPNTYLLLRAAQQRAAELERSLEITKGFTVQQCLDIAMIALHREFGFGAGYNARFGAAYRAAFLEYARLCVDDAADDDDIVYTKAVLDRELAAACGGEVTPFDERYALDKLYFRGRLDDGKTKKEG